MEQCLAGCGTVHGYHGLKVSWNHVCTSPGVVFLFLQDTRCSIRKLAEFDCSCAPRMCASLQDLPGAGGDRNGSATASISIPSGCASGEVEHALELCARMVEAVWKMLLDALAFVVAWWVGGWEPTAGRHEEDGGKGSGQKENA